MRKIVMMSAACGLLVAIAGCSSFETNRVGEQVEVKMPLNVEPEVELGQTMVEGDATVNCLFGIFTWGVTDQAVGVDYWADGSHGGASFMTSPAEIARDGAAFVACESSKADLLVAPRYNLSTMNYFVFKKVKCQVKGYPGVLKSVKIKK